MCSIAAQRIAEIGKAIDDLAATGTAMRKAEAGSEPAPSGADPIVARVAELWALLAELDPEMGKRLAGYQNLSTQADLRPARNRAVDRAFPVLTPPAQGRPIHVNWRRFQPQPWR